MTFVKFLPLDKKAIKSDGHSISKGIVIAISQNSKSELLPKDTAKSKALILI